jgi:hypothetical protein
MWGRDEEGEGEGGWRIGGQRVVWRKAMEERRKRT